MSILLFEIVWRQGSKELEVHPKNIVVVCCGVHYQNNQPTHTQLRRRVGVGTSPESLETGRAGEHIRSKTSPRQARDSEISPRARPS